MIRLIKELNKYDYYEGRSCLAASLCFVFALLYSGAKRALLTEKALKFRAN
jgi:hypothetical protein